MRKRLAHTWFLASQSEICIARYKKLVYQTYVRPKLEYASSIWHPSHAYLTYELEAIQNRAARFIMSNYSSKTSITELKRTLDLPSL